VRRLAVVLLLMIAAPAAAQSDACLTADPPAPKAEPSALRIGITPRIAGSAGALQGTAAPEDLGRNAEALRTLRGADRQLVLRLNRLFWADGEQGIEEFEALVDRYAAAGLTSEIQVRYHPPAGHEGDIDGWERFVRLAVRRLGAKPTVVGFSITNEANDGVVDALVRGVLAARDEGRRIGRPGLLIGFNVAWRWAPNSDAKFWNDIGARSTKAFRRALDYVGVQVYPGLVWPPVMRPGVSAGAEVAEALSLVRDCYMPMARLGRGIDLWVSENGYPTNLGRDEASQAEHLESTLRTVHALSTTLGITDYRYFNLRDNDSDGTDLFSAVGLLRDDYTEKPAFAAFGSLVAELGAGPPIPRIQLAARRAGGRLHVDGRLALPRGAPACTGRVTVAAAGRRRALALGRRCRFAAVLRAPRRPFSVVARYPGATGLAAARSSTGVR
jgi:hypothetical protein